MKFRNRQWKFRLRSRLNWNCNGRRSWANRRSRYSTIILEETRAGGCWISDVSTQCLSIWSKCYLNTVRLSICMRYDTGPVLFIVAETHALWILPGYRLCHPLEKSGLWTRHHELLSDATISEWSYEKDQEYEIKARLWCLSKQEFSRSWPSCHMWSIKVIEQKSCSLIIDSSMRNFITSLKVCTALLARPLFDGW